MICVILTVVSAVAQYVQTFCDVQGRHWGRGGSSIFAKVKLCDLH